MGKNLDRLNGGQRWSLSAIHGLRDTGASMHNGIEPPTRGFSILAFCNDLTASQSGKHRYQSG